MLNITCYCSRRTIDGLKMPKFALAYRSFWSSNSFISRTTVWTSSINVYVDSFFYIESYSLNMMRKTFPALVPSLAEKCDLFWVSSVFKLYGWISCKKYSWISCIKLSLDGFIFSESDFKKTLLCTSLRSLDKSIVPRNAEKISFSRWYGGIPQQTRFKILFLYFLKEISKTWS